MRHAVAFSFLMTTAATLLLAASGERVPEVNADEKILLAAGLGTDGASLVEFFRDRARPKADLDKLVALARQLGDANAQTRAKAAAKLIARGPWAVPALRHIANDLDNPLAAQQARRCLEWVEGQRSTDVPIAAANLLAVRKPAAAAATLLAFLPLADDQAVVDAIKAALCTIAAGPGKTDAALLAALHDRLPLRRAVAVEVLASSGQPALLPEVRKLLADPKPQVRLRAALALVQRGDEIAVDVLIDLLADLPQDERRQAEQVLQQLAGEWSPAPALRGDDELSRKVRREAWAGWWRTMNGPALLAAFRRRTLSEEDLASVRSLIDQLGDSSFAKRDRAVAELMEMGPKVVGLLREAVKSTDLERAKRAEICLKHIVDIERKERLPTAAPRLLAVRKPPGAAAALLGYLPFTDDYVMKQEIGKALKNVVLVDGQADPAVLKALSDPWPVRQIAAAEALTGAGDVTHWPAVRKLLTDISPEVRLRVAVALVHVRDKESVPALIDLLAVLPRTKTWEVKEILLRLAGDKAPKRLSGDDAAARMKLHEAWQAWWRNNGAALDMAAFERLQSGLGLTVVAEISPNAPKAPGKKAAKGAVGKKGVAINPLQPAMAGGDRLVALNRTGQARWQIDHLDYPIDFQLLPGERVLIAEYSGNRVTERDLKGNILWKVNLPGPPINVQRLANGNTFIGLYGSAAQILNQGQPQMMEVDPAGKTVATFNVGAAQQFLKGPAGGGGGFGGGGFNANDLLMLAAYKMADGQMVCLVGYDTCIRMDATGKEVKRFPVPRTKIISLVNTLGNIEVTANGHIVFVQNDNAVTEYDADGKNVWQAGAAGGRAARLANGNTLVASPTGGVRELDGAGHTVWQYQPPGSYQAVRARRR